MVNLKEDCIEMCRLHGYAHAGFQYEDDCFCGDDALEDLIDYKVSELKCDWKWGEPIDVEPDIDNFTLFIYHTGSVPNQLSPLKIGGSSKK